MIERVIPSAPLSPQQWMVATLLGAGQSHKEVADALAVRIKTVRWHLRGAAKKLPGDLPAEMRVVAWVRGATLDVLTGTPLRFEMFERAMGFKEPLPPSTVRGGADV